MIKNRVVYTPHLRDTILPGITRKSIMTLAMYRLYLSVCIKDISVEELVRADEVFTTGTAAVVTPIGAIKDGEKEYIIGNGQVGQTTRNLYELLTGIQCGDIEDKSHWLKKV